MQSPSTNKNKHPSNPQFGSQRKTLLGTARSCDHLRKRQQRVMPFTFSQFKSMTTLPSPNYSNSNIQSKELIEAERSFKKVSPRQNSSLHNISEFKNSKISKVSALSKKLGHIYSRAQRAQWTSKPSVSHQCDRILKLQEQNTILRSQLLDCQLKEREDVERINKLEKLCIKLQEIIESKATVTRQQEEFLKMMTSTFQDCFGIKSCKDMWKKQKEILQQWMQNKIQQQKSLQRSPH